MAYDAGTSSEGHRCGMTDASGTTTWTYDVPWRTASEAPTISGQLYTTSWTYNSVNLPISVSCPDGKAVATSYAARKLFNVLASLQETYVQSTDHHFAARMTVRVPGNNTITGAQYPGLHVRFVGQAQDHYRLADE